MVPFLTVCAIMLVLAVISFASQSGGTAEAANRVATDPGGSFGAIVGIAIALFVFFFVVGVIVNAMK